MKNKSQMDLFINNDLIMSKDITSTFSANLSIPIHRWFRYSAGFSAPWARDLINREKRSGRQTVLDPFAGSGTVLLESEACDLKAVGVEAHPFVARIARSKLCWRESPKLFHDYALSVLEKAKTLNGNIDHYPKLIQKCFPQETIVRLDALQKAWRENADGSPFSELTWLVLASILRECSPVGTAQWQYILPNKRKLRVTDPFNAFSAKAVLMSNDMATCQMYAGKQKAILHWEDARTCFSVPDASIDLVITSPPYANNYDYADATRLEMSFFGEIQDWGDLQDSVRKYLVRSCTQHVAKITNETYNILKDDILSAIQKDIYEVCEKLETEREKHGGKKPYHTMIAAYFSDMAKMWVALRRVTTSGALICFVVGDSAPYGVYVPVEKWLGELALSAGFKSYYFEKIRERNVKWKNRKHRVPLHEGYLWITG